MPSRTPLRENIFSKRLRFSSVLPAVRPMFSRKRRISGWKMMIIASAPTSSRAPSSEDIILSPTASANTRTTIIIMMAMKMYIAEVPRIQWKTR